MFVVLFFFLFVVFCITQTPARPSQEHPKIPQDSPRPPQDHLNTPQDHPRLSKEHFKISQDAPRAAQGEGVDDLQSTPYYSRAQVTRARIPSPPQKTSRLSLRTPPCPWLQKASFFMSSTGLFTLPHFPLAQVNRTRSPTKAGWLTVCRGPCFCVTFCFLWFFFASFFSSFFTLHP